MESELVYYPRNVRTDHGSRSHRLMKDPDAPLSFSIANLQSTLFSCLRGARPAREHVETLLSTNTPGMNGRVATQLIERWITIGLLIRKDSLHWQCDRTFVRSNATEKSTLGYVCLTAGRAEAVSRWSTALGTSPVVRDNVTKVVFDDSHENEDYSREGASPFPLIDRAARESAITDIDRNLRSNDVVVEYKVLRFLLLGECGDTLGLPTIGANRNSALLLSGFDRLICCDDDVLPPVKRLTGVKYNGEHPTLLKTPVFDTVFAPDLATLEQDLEAAESYNLQAELTRFLGRVSPNNLDLDDSPAEAISILNRPGCTVHAVSIGLYGARQYTHPFRTFLVRGEHRDDLLYDRDLFETVRVNPLLARQAAEVTIDTGMSFLTAMCAIDARSPRLPFFPLARKEDDNYRMLYRICFPEQLFANLPAAVFHDPRYKAGFTEQEFESYPIDLGIWTHMLTQRFARRLHHSDGEGRLREMSLSFDEFGRLNPEQIRRFLTPLHSAYYQSMLKHIRGELELYQGPPWWVEDRRHAVAVLERELDGGIFESDEQLVRYAKVYRLWGNALRVWPEIVRATRPFSE